MSSIKHFIPLFLLGLSACSSVYDKQVGYGVAEVQQAEASPEYFDRSPLFFGKVDGSIVIEFQLEETNVYRILGAAGHVTGWAVFDEVGLIKIVNLEGETTNILHQDKKGAYHIYDVDGTYLGVMGFEEENPDHYYMTSTNGDPLGRVSVPVHPVYNPYGYYDSWGRYHGLGYGYGNPIWGHWGHGSKRAGYYRRGAKSGDGQETGVPNDVPDVQNTPPTTYKNKNGEDVFRTDDVLGEGDLEYNNQLPQRPQWQTDPRPRTTTPASGPVLRPQQVWKLNRETVQGFYGEDQLKNQNQSRIERQNVQRPSLRNVNPRVITPQPQTPQSGNSGFRPESQPRFEPKLQPSIEPQRYQRPQARQRSQPTQRAQPQVRPQPRPTPAPRPRVHVPRPQQVGKPKPVIRDRENNND